MPYLRTLLSYTHTRASSSGSGCSKLHELYTMLYLAAALASPGENSARAPLAPGSARSVRILVPTQNGFGAGSVHHLSPYSTQTTPGSSLPCSPPPELAPGEDEDDYAYPTRDAEALALFTHAFEAYDAPPASLEPDTLATPKVSACSPPMFALSISPGVTSNGGTSPTFISPSLAGTSYHGHHHQRKQLGPKTELWTRAAYAALLRRMGKRADAGEVVDVIRYVLPPCS